ncbi:MAG: nucleotide 5'-monophosphate nucleosidase PpnN [Gammaproteobacteria bacterium]|nr:nucleotide 5'-monophosphate nucleosidase PpnN [Gammaproteobacteria bacterium]
MDATVTPEGSLEVLSQQEVQQLRHLGEGGMHELFRRCCLAVLNSGSEVDDARLVFDQHKNFDIELIQQDRGIRLKVSNAPEQAFVDGRMIRGLREHLFAVLRDVVYMRTVLADTSVFDPESSAGITNSVFHALRHARILHSNGDPNIAVCWGGHAISREEYDYTKKVGYQLGLRGMNICTGCGPGAMKGPMKGATIAHAKQRIVGGRYLGLTEPGIIAAEPPNAIVNELVILPDIEKRLEAFVRVGHSFIVFPGGVGTAEEILYLLGILLHPGNADLPFPLVFSGPASAADYFKQIDRFLRFMLGESIASRYEIVTDDPARAAHLAHQGTQVVKEYRQQQNDAYFFNWMLSVDPGFQHPFKVDHESMRSLSLHRDLPSHVLASNLRKAFSGIVTGNVKEHGIRMVEEQGPFEIIGEPGLATQISDLLKAFVAQKRMRLPTTEYKPCFTIISR